MNLLLCSYLPPYSFAILSGAIFMIALPTHLTAAQFDAPYYDLQEKNKDKWAAEDKQINAKSDKPFFIYWATYTQQ